MTDQPSEIILIKYLVEAQEALANAKKLQDQITSGNEQIKSSNASASKSFQEISNAITNEGKAANWTKQQINDAIQSEIQRLQQLGTVITGIPPKIKQMGEAAQQAKGGFSALAAGIGAAFGISAISIVRNFFQSFINYVQQAIQSGYEFAKGMFQLEVGVNALRRAGTDITFGEVLAQLKKLKTEFGIFATKDLVIGASAFLNLNRDMGFTKEQLFELQDAIATLAVVNGRAMDEVQKTVALALSSGYTEGLQRLGVSINRVNIAQEAAILGWDKGYTALTEQQRALATYNLIIEKTAVYMDDLLKYQNKLPGQIDTTKAAIIDANKTTGESLLGVRLAWEKLKLGVVNAIGTIITFVNGARDAEQKAADDEEEILGRRLNVWEKFIVRMKASQDWAANVINAYFYGKELPTEEGLGTAPEVAPPETGLSDEQALAFEAAADKILDLQKQYDIDRRDMAIDLQRDLARIEADGADKLAELAANHAQKMLDIANKASEQIRDARLKYGLDVKQAWDDYYGNIASAAEKHSNKLLKVEEDYQEKLKRLKEGFLLDMEDALQARDARQVLKLIRQYNLEKTQTARERDQNFKEEERTYREQLNELDRQRDDRLKKLKEEFDLRNAELIRQRDRELALEVEAYTKKKIEQEAQNKKDLDDRELKNQQDLDDLKLHLKDRTDAIAQGLIDDGIATNIGLQGLLDITNTYIGPDGVITQTWAAFIAYVQGAMAAAMGVMTTGSGWMGMPTLPPLPSTGGHSQGGIEVASRPTTAVFGDAGAEVALFLPLSKLLSGASSSRSELPTMAKTGGKEGNGKAQIEILLGAGLEGRIIDQALNQVANITLRSVTR